MLKSILGVLERFFSPPSGDFERSDAFRDLELKKNRVRMMIQGRLI